MTITNSKYVRILDGMKALKDTEDQIKSLRERREEQMKMLHSAVKGEKRTPELIEFVCHGFMAMYNCQAVPSNQLSPIFTGREADGARSMYFRTIAKLLPRARKAKASKAKAKPTVVDREIKRISKLMTKAQLRALLAALKAKLAE